MLFSVKYTQYSLSKTTKWAKKLATNLTPLFNQWFLKVELESLKTQSELDIRIGLPLSIAPFCYKCEAASGKLNIKYDGNVFPCEVFKNERMPQVFDALEIDNIYRSSLFDIYSNSKYLDKVRFLAEKYAYSETCETCLGQYLLANGDNTYGK